MLNHVKRIDLFSITCFASTPSEFAVSLPVLISVRLITWKIRDDWTSIISLTLKIWHQDEFTLKIILKIKIRSGK